MFFLSVLRLWFGIIVDINEEKGVWIIDVLCSGLVYKVGICFDDFVISVNGKFLFGYCELLGMCLIKMVCELGEELIWLCYWCGKDIKDVILMVICFVFVFL